MKASLLAIVLTMPPIWVSLAHSHLSHRPPSPEEFAIGWLDSARQTFEHSCGPALLASMARYVGLPLSEFHLLASAEVHLSGITLSEFRRLAIEVGWSGDWFGGVYDNLLFTKLPVAAHLSFPADHFVLVHYVTDSHVLIEDPVSGISNVDRATFENRWSGYFYASE